MQRTIAKWQIRCHVGTPNFSLHKWLSCPLRSTLLTAPAVAPRATPPAQLGYERSLSVIAFVIARSIPGGSNGP